MWDHRVQLKVGVACKFPSPSYVHRDVGVYLIRKCCEDTSHTHRVQCYTQKSMTALQYYTASKKLSQRDQQDEEETRMSILVVSLLSLA